MKQGHWLRKSLFVFFVFLALTGLAIFGMLVLPFCYFQVTYLLAYALCQEVLVFEGHLDEINSYELVVYHRRVLRTGSMEI